MFLVLVDDVRGGGVGPLLESRAQVRLFRPNERLELFAVVEMRQLGHFPHEIVEVSLPFVRDLIINNADGLVGDRGDEASGEPFD